MTSTVLCAYSGIEFPVPHFSHSFYSRECSHPIFTLPTTKLVSLVETAWLEQRTSPVENYLLYLALFNATGMMEFRTPAKQTAETASIVATNMVQLAEICTAIAASGQEKVREVLYLPSLVITPDTSSLESSGDWIAIWQAAYASYRDHYKTATELERLVRKETNLERKIKDRSKDIATYARDLANWAADAGKFPLYDAGLDPSILGGQRMSLRDYWITIIISCCKLENIWSIPDGDLQELTEHCEENIPHGSIFAATLMVLLRSGTERKRSFFNLGDIDLGNGNTFRILDADTSIEDANKLALIDSAPKTAPIESQYPNKLAYIRAKMNFRMAQEYAANTALHAANQETAQTRIGDLK